MTDEELKSIFPYGALLVPRAEGAPSTRVVVGQDEWDDDDYPDYFNVWRDPQRNVVLSRDLKAENDGYVTDNGNGDKYFLRPLTEDRKFTFDA
jgi:hypothetical protein